MTTTRGTLRLLATLMFLIGANIAFTGFVLAPSTVRPKDGASAVGASAADGREYTRVETRREQSVTWMRAGGIVCSVALLIAMFCHLSSPTEAPRTSAMLDFVTVVLGLVWLSLCVVLVIRSVWSIVSGFL